MGKSSPPPAPNYVAAAQAQGQANQQAALQTGLINNPNVVNPNGTQNVTWSQDATTGMYQPTVTQTLSPAQQQLYNQQVTTQGLLGGLGEQGATSLKGVVGTPVSFSNAPASPQANQVNQQAVSAAMARPLQDYARQKDQLNSDLAAAGIPVGSAAYNTQQDLLNRQLTDAQQQATLTGAQVGQQFYNQEAQSRQQAIAEQLAQRQIPLNEITALMSGSQVSNPFSVPNYAQNASAVPAPIFGAATAQGNYASDIYNAQQAQKNALMGGLFGLGSSGITAYGLSSLAPAAAASDRRLKRKIQRIGTHPLGIGIYSYEIFGKPDVGVMADEVLQVKPEAVITRYSGYLMVDYARL